MKRLVAFATVAVLTLTAWTATAAQENHNPLPHACTAKAFRPFAAKVWAPSLWQRGKPDRGSPAIKAQRRRLACAPVAHRKVMKRFWQHKQDQFFKHRSAELERRREQREMEAVTPYDCGSHGRFAIPCGVVECESHFDWDAVNASSGAFTAYQFLPSTYEETCVRCDGSRLDYHETAGIVWARSGGGEWVCAG